MQLFEESGNFNVEGVDTINACYGGTNAIFNTVDWFESSGWDGRDALVVAGDIALYKKGNARPTGGAGCVAFLIGPDAPIVIEPGLRGTYIKHEYDFYKPDFASEYPVVFGHYSMKCYTECVDNCYRSYNAREAQLTRLSNCNGINGHKEQEVPLDRFDHICFHAPTCKLVSKSYARLLYNDYLSDPNNPLFAEVPGEIKNLTYEASISDKSVEKTFMALAKERYAERVQPTIEVPTMCGNMYCASVYSSLCSLLMNVDSEQLQGKRVGVFSYGSGLASSFFSLRIKGSTKEITEKMDIKSRLASRRTVEPAVYDEVSWFAERR
jgi:hydroxymethylglutaryl-CoA synthase